METIRLGLIGDNIRESRAPALHRYCGQLAGLDVTYELFIPPVLSMNFDEVFDLCQSQGLRGVNVTLPYKERVLSRIDVDDPQIRRIGAVNTVLFSDAGPRGFNTDYSGFIAAYRSQYGNSDPGRVVMVGAGGVGRAVAFGLVQLGAREIVLVDHEIGKAEALAKDVRAAGQDVTRCSAGSIDAIAGADGVVNCTPLGMFGYPGSPILNWEIPTGGWAFDAVYTPVDTPFKRQAESAGANFLSGYELFFHQGIQAFEIFTGFRPVELDELRTLLGSPQV